MRLSALLFVALVISPALVLCQQPEPEPEPAPNATCSACEQVFVVTGKNLYVVDPVNQNFSVCATDFCNAKGVTVDENGNIFVADEGDKSIYWVSANCTEEKKLIVRNDGNLTSWLFPNDITVDDNNTLYVTMYEYDPMWPTYDQPRKQVAKERHVYKLYLDETLNFTGDFDILAGGINNGRDINHVRWVKDEGLWGSRQNRYVVRYVDDMWEDWLGPNNAFRINETSDALLGVRQVDSSFSKCGFMAMAADANRQLFTCKDQNDVGSCGGICQLNNNTNTTTGFENDQNVEQCMSDDCIGSLEQMLSFSSGDSSSSDSEKCQDLMVPYGVTIGCSCNLYVSDLGSQQLVMFNGTDSSSSDDSSSSSLGNSTMIMQFAEPVYGLVTYVPSNCTANTQ